MTHKSWGLAERLTFNKTRAAPELRVISWESRPGRHNWARPSWTQALDATAELIDFFFERELDALLGLEQSDLNQVII